MENYEKLIEQLLKADTPKGRYEYLVYLIENQKKEVVKRKSILDRKLEFKDKLSMFQKDISIRTLDEFFNYWTEIGEGQLKMRFEKETTFEISKRLDRWVRNNFNKQSNAGNKQVIQHSVEHKKDFSGGFR